MLRLIDMGLDWPRDQMAGSVRRWRRHQYTHSVMQRRDRAIDVGGCDGDKSRNQNISRHQSRLIGRSCLLSIVTTSALC